MIDLVACMHPSACPSIGQQKAIITFKHKRLHWKKWSQNSCTPGAVSWYATELHSWHYFAVWPHGQPLSADSTVLENGSSVDGWAGNCIVLQKPLMAAKATKAAKADISARAAIPVRAANRWKTWAGIAALPAATGFCRTMQFPAHVCQCGANLALLFSQRNTTVWYKIIFRHLNWL